MLVSSRLAVLALAALAAVASAARFENEWDQNLDFTCPPNSGQGIYFIETDGHFTSRWKDKKDRK